MCPDMTRPVRIESSVPHQWMMQVALLGILSLGMSCRAPIDTIPMRGTTWVEVEVPTQASLEVWASKANGSILVIDQCGINVQLTFSESNRSLAIDGVVGRHGKERVFLPYRESPYVLSIKGAGDGNKGSILIGLKDYPTTGNDPANLFELQRTHFEYLHSDAGEHSIDQLLSLMPRYEQLQAHHLKAEALDRIAEINLELGRYNESLQFNRQAAWLYRALGRDIAVAKVLNNTATSWHFIGEMEAAAKTYTEAGLIMASHQLTDWEANTLNNLGMIFLYQGRQHLALQCLTRAADLFNQTNWEVARAHALSNMGSIHAGFGEHEQALRFLLRAESILKQHGNEDELGWVYRGLGNVHRDSANKEQAQAYYAKAIEIAEGLADKRLLADVLNSWALLDLIQGRPVEAASHLSRSIDLNKPAFAVRSHYLMGRIAMDHFEDPESAIGHFETAKTIATSSNQDAFLAEVNFRLAEIHSILGRNDVGSYLNDAVRLVEEERDHIHDLALRQHFFAGHRRLYDFYRDWLLSRHGNEAKALALADQSRSRTLLDRARDAQLQSEIPTNHHFEIDWAGLVNPPNRRALPNLAEFENVAAWIPRDSIVLEYALGSSRSWVFALSQLGVEVFELPPSEIIEQNVVEALRIIRSDKWSTFLQPDHQASLRSLTETLLGHLDLTSFRQVIIVGDGALLSLPFQALPLKTATYQPLLTTHEVIYVPSLGLWRTFDSKATSPQSAAFFGDAVYTNPKIIAALQAVNRDSLLGRLYASKREVETLAQMCRERMTDVQLAVRYEVTQDRVHALELDPPDLLHFATHGIMDPEDPQRSRLVLSQYDAHDEYRPSALTFEDICRRSLCNGTVVLSGCQTGIGMPVAGEGQLSLAWAFMHGGATRVIASLWRVNDNSSAQLMIDLYRGVLEDQLSFAQALRQAQLKMWLQRETSLPYHWAAYVHWGQD